MNYLSVQGLGKSFGIQTLFKGLNFGVDQGQKVALVARNGTGKTTILKALAGLEPPDTGEIVYRKGIQVAFLKQESDFGNAKTVFEAKYAIENGIYDGRELLNSSVLTAFAFKEGLNFFIPFGDKIVTLSVLLFAISTAIAWSFYGNRSAVFLFGEKSIKPYLWIYVIFVFIGAIAELETIWAFGDAALGIMTFPNLISIVLLTGSLKVMTKDYFAKEHSTHG